MSNSRTWRITIRLAVIAWVLLAAGIVGLIGGGVLSGAQPRPAPPTASIAPFNPITLAGTGTDHGETFALPAGSYVIAWDIDDASGSPAPGVLWDAMFQSYPDGMPVSEPFGPQFVQGRVTGSKSLGSLALGTYFVDVNAAPGCSWALTIKQQ